MDRGNRCPVVDFDHHSPEHASDPWEVYRRLREETPVARTEAYGGFTVVTRYDDVAAIAKDWATFSSEHDVDGSGNGYGGVTIPSPPVHALPTELDPPDHTKIRNILMPLFTGAALQGRRPRIEALVKGIVDRVIDRGACDLIDDIAAPVPAVVTLDLLGMPTSEWKRYAGPMHTIVYAPQDTPEYAEAVAGTEWILGHVGDELERRRAAGETGDDVLGRLLAATVDGEPLSHQTMLEVVWLVIVGGLDNTASLLANAFLYLYRHPDERERLRGDRRLAELAFHEFLRYFTVTQGLARTATTDTEVGGYPVTSGERVFIVWAAANRDPAVFDRPDEIVLDRSPNRHLGFGLGVHRCIGAHIAQEMFVSTMLEVLERMPDYIIDEAALQHYPSAGIAYGYISMPATYTPSIRS